jgi:hypothetical protein
MGHTMMIITYSKSFFLICNLCIHPKCMLIKFVELNPFGSIINVLPDDL